MTIRTKFWLTEEPRADVYKRLVDLATKRAVQFSLVVLKELPPSDECRAFLSDLEGDLIRVMEKSDWPGTRLLYGKTALVHFYSASPNAVEKLKHKVTALYDWLYPELPEDLAVYRADGSLTLASSSHEQFAFMELSDDEVAGLGATLPTLRYSKTVPGESQ